jgi:hypothetical protein
MRFLSMIRINENNGLRPSEQLMSDMGKLLEEITKAGVMLDTAGLRPTSEGVRVRLAHGKISVVDGPFTETKEVIGGYALMETKSMEEAIHWTTRFLKVHGRASSRCTARNGTLRAKCASWKHIPRVKDSTVRTGYFGRRVRDSAHLADCPAHRVSRVQIGRQSAANLDASIRSGN